jgi:hypothetical protein
MRTKTKLVTAVGLAGLVAAAVNLRSGEVTAADHVDSPQSMADAAADITDLYAWHNGEGGRLYVVLGFAGLSAAGGDPTYDADVLYTIHIDDDGDREPEHQIYVRFGQNLLEEWGVRVDNLPGEAGPFEGPVGEAVAGKAGGQVQAGLFDDPFFFDLDGYLATIMSATEAPGESNLMFDSANDSFAGTNVTAIVLDMDAAAADVDGDGQIQMWATTGRLTR